MSFKGKTVLITGAAGGIGRHLASLFSNAGANLILWDVDLMGLEELRVKLGSGKGNIRIAPVNLVGTIPRRSAIESLIREGVIPDVIINNAGKGASEAVHKNTAHDIWYIGEINFSAPVDISQCFIKAAIASSKKIHIVNVCSGQVFFKLPSWSLYAATKAALSVYSEALGREAKKDGVTVTTVYPFMVDTGFYHGIKEKDGTFMAKMAMKLLPYYSQKPGTVANIIFKAIKNKKEVEMVHPANWVGYYLDIVPVVGRLTRKLLCKLLLQQRKYND